MLFAKPFFLWRANKRGALKRNIPRTNYNQLVSEDSENDDYLEADRYQVRKTT
jgi:hypothetical protein